MADGIIDIRDYLRDDEDDGWEGGEGTFSLVGGEGERARFALPLWRVIYLAEGDRGAIVGVRSVPSPQETLVALDLGSDPARTDFRSVRLPEVPDGRRVAMADDGPGGLAVFLGDAGGRRWFMVIDGVKGRNGPLAAKVHEDILFLAGECAALLLFRDLAELT